ncbi:hypothetical protein BASA50_003904 [Batrachochytrium salamandrivorans]|uniref:Uncharacterized protein n=1 Tax=Batrachochytrium salamandrivorans TaxID=1357716 RepID=A0ABQ8FHK5_9FUNG|nr:hypothetical protein BASA50_003904 [Batrachochytrium salamandrivorans]
MGSTTTINPIGTTTTTANACLWEDGVFHSLHELLVRSLTDTSPPTLARLHTVLIQRRSDFALLLHEPKRDPQLKLDLDKGFVSIHGKMHPANAPFCTGVAELAALLDLNEARAAAIYNAALTQRARFGDASDIEACLHLYYGERECLLNCIDTMLFEFQSLSVPAESRRITDLFLAEFLPTSHASTASSSLPSRLLVLIHQTSAQIHTLTSSINAAASTTSAQIQNNPVSDAPQKQRTAMLASLQLRRLVREQLYFSNILILCAHEHGLTADESAHLLRLLKTISPSDRVLPYILGAVMAQFDRSSNAYQRPTTRFVLNESSYTLLRELIVLSEWENSCAMGIVWLSWTAFLDMYVRSDSLSDTQVRVLIGQELDGSRRSWFSKFGGDPEIYNLLDRCMLLNPNATHDSLGTHRTYSQDNSSAREQGHGAIANPSASLGTSALSSYSHKATFTAYATASPEDLDAITDDIRQDVSVRVVLIIERLLKCLFIRMRRYLRQTMVSDQDIAASQESRLGHFTGQQQLSGASNNGGYSIHRPHATMMPEEKTITSWEALLSLLKNMYTGRSDAAKDWFSHSELFGFLKLGSEVWAPRFIVAFLDFLCAISSGPVCAFQTHEILNDDQTAEFGQILWSTFFRTLNSYIERLHLPVPATDLQPAESMLITSFLRLLGQIVRFSFTARLMLCENQHFRALHTLFQLLVSRIHVDMKASLFDAISAFCHPADEGAEIVQQVWFLLEQSQIVSTTPRLASGMPSGNDRRTGRPSAAPVGGHEGIAYDLFEVETCSQTYPETRAFLGLLITLLSNPPRPLVASVYESLGAPERVGGIRPYMTFVIDDVLLRSAERPYSNPSERWQITEAAIQIIDLAVAMFDMSAFQLPRDADGFAISGSGSLASKGGLGSSNDAASTTRHASLGLNFQTHTSSRSLAAQPGFEIYCRILQGSALTAGIFDILGLGAQQLGASSYSQSSKLTVRSMSAALSVLLAILSNQRVFLEILAPALVESGDGSIFNLPVSMVGLDQLLAFNKKAIVDIALFVSSSESKISLAAITILSQLSLSPVFSTFDSSSSFGSPSRLVSVLLASDESNRILQAFVDRLELDEADEEHLPSTQFGLHNGDSFTTHPLVDASFNNALGSLGVAANTTATGSGASASSVSIRCAILDLLIANISRGGSPNLAHFLLGYDCHRNMATTDLIDPSTQKGRVNCFHSILDLLARGVAHNARGRKHRRQQGHLDGSSEEDEGSDTDDMGYFSEVQPLSTTHPVLSEKCFHLIYSLCSSRSTGPPTMRYLRTREDFFLRQLVAMDPVHVRSNGTDSDDMSVPAIARLHQQAWLMRAVTLELHTTALAGQRTHMVRLLNHLIGLSTTGANPARSTHNQFDPSYLGGDEAMLDQDIDYDQPLAKMLDILKSMNFSEPDWPELGWNPAAFGISLDSYIRVNERGVDQYDVRSIYLALMGAVRLAERHTALGASVGTGVDGMPFNRDSVRQLVQSVYAINEVHRLSNARYQIAMAWGQLVRVSILDCVEMIPQEIRELRIFEILAGLLQKLSKGGSVTRGALGSTFENNSVSMSIGKTLSEVVTGLMARLQQDDRSQSVFRYVPWSMDYNKLDSWQHTILRGVLDGMLSPGTSLAMRGNYYAALVTYIQYIFPMGDAGYGDGVNSTRRNPLHLDAHLSHDEATAATSRGSSAISAMSSSRFLTSLAIIGSYGDRLIETICRDASDGEIVWQTVAYATLASLCSLENMEARLHGGHSIGLGGSGSGSGVAVDLTVKTVDDKGLRAILGSGTDDREHALNSKYVYDLKMSLFLKIAETKAGADRLVHTGIIEALSESLFIDERPDYGSYDHDLEQERYHDAILPVLQLILSIQSHYQPTHAVVRAKITRFINAHRDMVASTLRDKASKITLMSLAQVRLMTGIIVWMRREDDLLSKRLPGPGQSSIDDLMMQLLHKYALEGDWRSRITAVNDVETEKTCTVPAKVLAPVSAMSVFSIEAETLGEQIVVNLLAYWIEKSLPADYNEVNGSIQSSTLFGLHSQRDTMHTRAVVLLREYSDKLIQAISRRKTIQIKVADISQVPVDEINEIAQSFNRAAFEELSPSQRQMLALRDLQNAERLIGKDIQRLRAVVEMSALFFLQLVEGSADKSSTAAIAAALPVLEKLVGSGALPSDHGDGFIKMCIRCLA